MRRQRILDLFRASGDANLGQTLSRLAHLAAAVHRFESAGLTTRDAGAGTCQSPLPGTFDGNASARVGAAAANRDSMEDAR